MRVQVVRRMLSKAQMAAPFVVEPARIAGLETRPAEPEVAIVHPKHPDFWRDAVARTVPIVGRREVFSQPIVDRILGVERCVSHSNFANPSL